MLVKQYYLDWAPLHMKPYSIQDLNRILSCTEHNHTAFSVCTLEVLQHNVSNALRVAVGNEYSGEIGALKMAGE